MIYFFHAIFKNAQNYQLLTGRIVFIGSKNIKIVESFKGLCNYAIKLSEIFYLLSVENIVFKNIFTIFA